MRNREEDVKMVEKFKDGHDKLKGAVENAHRPLPMKTEVITVPAA